MKKISKMNESCWLLGNLLCALSIALCTKSGFGLSMIAAPPYIFNQFLVKTSPFFTQGACEYIFQAVLLIIMCLIIRRFNWKYLLSFASAFIFGNMVDFSLWIFGGQEVYESMVMRIIAFALSEVITALAIACYFRTSLPLCIYELFVKAVSERFSLSTDSVKMLFDIGMLLLSVAATLLLFGRFVGVGIGTVIITLVNAPLIKLWGKVLDKIFTYELRFPKFVKALN